MKELDRLQLMTRIAARRLTRRRAADLLQLSERQVQRRYRAFVRAGAAGLASRRRGRPSPRRLAAATRDRAVALVRERYADFGPTFAHQELTEEHALTLSVETLRAGMIAADVWVPRVHRARRSYQPRERRACRGELLQIDGSDHAWFEDRGPRCTLLVYIDDATSDLMALCFADVESTFDYCHATRRYLERYGKPMAFYSDRHSIVHVQARDRAQGGPGLSQFGRAVRDLHIDSICANSPQAKGRVERANGPLQDRLVQELRLRGISRPAEAAPFLPIFLADHNRRFAIPPRVAHDAHRALHPDDDLTQIFTLQEPRLITTQLTVNYKRGRYLREDTVENRRLRRTSALVSEAADGPVTIRGDGRVLPYRLHPRDQAVLVPGVVVAHEHLDGAFAWIAAQQRARNAARLANPKITRRAKQRLQTAMAPL